MLIEDMYAGPPIPPFLDVVDDANYWADLASRAELKAYAVACFARLTSQDRDAFLDWARGYRDE